MKLKSFIKRLVLIEEIIDKINSPINGEILVYEDLFGKRSMRIGKVSQSGGLVEDIWRSALKVISNKQLVIRDCLILGLGCGDAARIVSKRWQEAEITGVEIDPKVIEVGKKYFKLGEVKNLKIVIGNALEVGNGGGKCEACRPARQRVRPQAKSGGEVRSGKWDLILVDLYLGQNFSKEAESEEFINGLKNILSNKGIVVFNRFNWGEYRWQAKDFKEKLEKHFSKVWIKKTVSNLLIYCQE